MKKTWFLSTLPKWVLGLILLIYSPKTSSAQKNEHKFSWSGHNGKVRSMAVTPDNKFVVTAGVDGMIKIWDKSSGALIRSMVDGRRNSV